ncbi:MAG: hypothetical protein NUV47_00915 [Patescibacteria group bacterium]|nr:hypothetical protein [Patescibacteria group bacterium]
MLNSFFKEFIRNWREVGSIVPSSNFLIKKMLKTIDFKRAKIIVEFGPGSGCMTKELLKKMNSDSKLIVFESNNNFCRRIKNIDDSRITIFNESALNLKKHLNKQRPNYIISGIPLANLSESDKKNLLLSSYDALIPEGRFIQFQYSIESLNNLKNTFDDVSIDFTILNIPPAFVFSCLKK